MNKYSVSTLALLCLLCLASVTQIDGPTQIKRPIIIDCRTFGCKGAGNVLGTGSCEEASIQAALDAVPNGTIGASQAPAVVYIPPGQYTICNPLHVDKFNTTIRGAIATYGKVGSTSVNYGTWLVASSTFDGPILRISPDDIATATGIATPAAVGIGLEDIGMDVQAATDNGHFQSHAITEAFSTSRLPAWKNIIWSGQQAGCLRVQADHSSASNNIVYNAEQIQLIQFQCFGNLNVTGTTRRPTGNGMWFTGVNELTLQGGVISLQNEITPLGGGSTNSNDFAAIQFDCDSFGLCGGGMRINDVHTTSYAVHFRIRGGDVTQVPWNGTSCTTHPGCPIGSPFHSSPTDVKFLGNRCEDFVQCLVIRDEPNTSGGFNAQASDISFDQSNYIFFPYGSAGAAGQHAIWADFLSGGELDNNYRSTTAYVNGSGQPFLTVVFNSSSVVSVRSLVFYDPSFTTSLPITSGSGNSLFVVAAGRITFAQLPKCQFTTCSVPSTDAPSGTQIYCSDCASATLSGAVPASGGGSGRLLVSNGSSWVGT